MEGRTTWLCPEPAHHERFVDMERRMRPVRNVVFAVIGLGTLLVALDWGWRPLALFVVASVLALTADRGTARSPTPEWWYLALALGCVFAIGVGVLLTGGPRSAALPWMLVPVVGATSVFGTRGVVVVLSAAVATAVAATVPVSPQEFASAPTYVTATIILIVAVWLYVHALMAVEVNLRHERVLDPLTGLLNRTTLDGRFRELCAQALVAREPVAMLLIDLDHFKRINDSSGHDAGDAVLREVAYELRGSLRAFEAAYRLGGEEFLVLLPGLDEPRAVEHAERLRRRIAASRPGGVAVTASIGLSAGAGDELVYERLFELADRRLYEAKHAGRDRVVPSPFAAAAPVRLAG